MICLVCFGIDALQSGKNIFKGIGKSGNLFFLLWIPKHNFKTINGHSLIKLPLRTEAYF